MEVRPAGPLPSCFALRLFRRQTIGANPVSSVPTPSDAKRASYASRKSLCDCVHHIQNTEFQTIMCTHMSLMCLYLDTVWPGPWTMESWRGSLGLRSRGQGQKINKAIAIVNVVKYAGKLKMPYSTVAGRRCEINLTDKPKTQNSKTRLQD